MDRVVTTGQVQDSVSDAHGSGMGGRMTEEHVAVDIDLRTFGRNSVMRLRIELWSGSFRRWFDAIFDGGYCRWDMDRDLDSVAKCNKIKGESIICRCRFFWITMARPGTGEL